MCLLFESAIPASRGGDFQGSNPHGRPRPAATAGLPPERFTQQNLPARGQVMLARHWPAIGPPLARHWGTIASGRRVCHPPRVPRITRLPIAARGMAARLTRIIHDPDGVSCKSRARCGLCQGLEKRAVRWRCEAVARFDGLGGPSYRPREKTGRCLGATAGGWRYADRRKKLGRRRRGRFRFELIQRRTYGRAGRFVRDGRATPGGPDPSRFGQCR